MARAIVTLLRQKKGERRREQVSRVTYSDDPIVKPTLAWVKSLIRIHYPEFIINEQLIILQRLYDGYAALRADDPKNSEFAWQYLEIQIIKHKKKQLEAVETN